MRFSLPHNTKSASLASQATRNLSSDAPRGEVRSLWRQLLKGEFQKTWSPRGVPGFRAGLCFGNVGFRSVTTETLTPKP